MIRIQSLDLCGFRGCKDHLQIEFGIGFTILSGLNGSGKSTVLDAIEFALTGAISKYEDTSGEKGEKASDYEWWRGEGQPSDKYVELHLLDEENQGVWIRRKPGLVEVRADQEISAKGEDALREILCDASLNPEASMAGLCRTSFIRDEFIASHSVDLPEAERFTFVRAAVGAQNTAHLQSKLRKARDELKERLAAAEREYVVARSRVEEAIERLSAGRGTIPSSATTREFEHQTRRSLRLPDTATNDELIKAADAEISLTRIKLDTLSQLLSRTTNIEDRMASPSFQARRARKDTLENEANIYRLALERNQDLMQAAETDYVRLKEGQELISNLAELAKAGRILGLRDGDCPLCGQSIEPGSFQQHISEVETEVQRFGNAISAAIEERSRLHSIENVTRKQLDAAEHELVAISAEVESLDRLVSEMGRDARAMYPDLQEWSSESIRGQMEVLSKRLSVLEQGRRLSSFPLLTSDMQSQEQELRNRRVAAAISEQKLSKLRRVDDQLKEALDTVKRFSAEAVEDRLAAIKPLFTELYSRLRPHIDWRSVDYSIRGDVRRFLSLRVDRGLNMKFLFSSGQRRAAGLAFLISVALSRPWSRLGTLILDDPIQHVDDFRAIHLVETLAAIRASGYQILCAVEDPNLAELLCRRLRSRYDEPGLLLEMKYVARSGTQIGEKRVIPPLGLALLAVAS
jgi:DNA repair exonuclease SbcCD ATPase subunit